MTYTYISIAVHYEQHLMQMQLVQIFYAHLFNQKIYNCEHFMDVPMLYQTVNLNLLMTADTEGLLILEDMNFKDSPILT